jgi:hypothetical protein
MSTKPRARRIAADEAHAWARNLTLGDAIGKAILVALTLYVDQDGCCYVSMAQLAEDCEVDIKTIRRRLDWLETDAKVLRRQHQWIDENGVRSSKPGGKQTTDAIQLLIEPHQTSIQVSPTHEGLPQKPGESRRSPVGVPVRSTLKSSEPEPESKIDQVFVIEGTKAWEAWVRYRRETPGQRPLNFSQRGEGPYAGKSGRWLPSLFPPSGPPSGTAEIPTDDFAQSA